MARSAISTMSKSNASPAGRPLSAAVLREQELCAAALQSGSYDDMSDADWIALCEQVARDTGIAKEEAKAEAEVM